MKTILTIILLALCTPLSFSQAVVSGTVLGADGTPMAEADIYLVGNTLEQPRPLLASARAGRDGTFRLAVPHDGFCRLTCAGVGHYALELPIVVAQDESVSVAVRLKAYEMPETLGGLRVIGDFNDFSFSRGARAMERNPDGTYEIHIAAAAETLAYQIIGAENTGRSINGTQSDYYVYDGGGDYRSVVRTHDGVAQIVFDPHGMPAGRGDAGVQFADASSRAARFYRVNADLEQRQERYADARKAEAARQEGVQAFSYDWSPDLREIGEQRRLEPDPMIRNAWLLAALSCGGLRSDSTLAVQALDSISELSPLWSYNPGILPAIVAVPAVQAAGITYLRNVIDRHPDRDIKPFLISELLSLAEMAGQDSIIPGYYRMLEAEYGNSVWTKLARSQYSPDRAVQPGRPVPDFSVVSLEDSAVRYSRHDLLGSVYMIDFWAVWCKPCLGEMKYIHDAYKEFGPKGLKILSLSFDNEPADVVTFRKDRWPMPWMHSFVKDGFESGLAKAFEVTGIPKPVLVGTDGNVIATETNLREDRLRQTLAKVFNK